MRFPLDIEDVCILLEDVCIAFKFEFLTEFVDGSNGRHIFGLERSEFSVGISAEERGIVVRAATGRVSNKVGGGARELELASSIKSKPSDELRGAVIVVGGERFSGGMDITSTGALVMALIVHSTGIVRIVVIVVVKAAQPDVDVEIA